MSGYVLWKMSMYETFTDMSYGSKKLHEEDWEGGHMHHRTHLDSLL